MNTLEINNKQLNNFISFLEEIKASSSKIFEDYNKYLDYTTDTLYYEQIFPLITNMEMLKPFDVESNAKRILIWDKENEILMFYIDLFNKNFKDCLTNNKPFEPHPTYPSVNNSYLIYSICEKIDVFGIRYLSNLTDIEKKFMKENKYNVLDLYLFKRFYKKDAADKIAKWTVEENLRIQKFNNKKLKRKESSNKYASQINDMKSFLLDVGYTEKY